MRAVVAEGPGGPGTLRVRRVPDPWPGPGQVRISVACANVAFLDTALRAGRPFGPRMAFPYVPGNGVGGVVDKVGAGVDPGWRGARVVSVTGGSGGYAEFALARDTDLHRVPGGLTMAEATALLGDGRTALGVHRSGKARAGETVVVTAAAGGVGGLLVQLAAASGTRVIALAGSEAKLAHAVALGAHAAVEYRGDGWAGRLRDLAPDGLDVVFDGVGASVTAELLPLTRAGGRYVRHGAAGGRLADLDENAVHGKEIVPLFAIGRTPEQLFPLVAEALALASAGRLLVTVGQTFPLAEAAAAHAAIEARATVGKTLLLP
ncbi:NADPH2:quinone reductase [Actinocorallia herbida]|uniref:NADPH2:quinone reductase n=1 Tax=Actinocorallia herbida TaxID=58109 RepID=A0A3N1DAA9_9ACTN|nr:NADPH2:quinone reductase [Actinocorallia herbida]